MIRLDYLVDGRGIARSTEASARAPHAADRRVARDGWIQIFQGIDFVGVRFAPETVKRQAFNVATRTLISGRKTWRWIGLSVFAGNAWHRSLPATADSAVAAMHAHMRSSRGAVYLSRRLELESAYRDRQTALVRSLSFALAKDGCGLSELIDYAHNDPSGRTTVLYCGADAIWRFGHLGYALRHFGADVRRTLIGREVTRSPDPSYARNSLRLVEEAAAEKTPTLRDHDALLDRPDGTRLHSTYRALRVPVRVADGVAVLSTFHPLTQQDLLGGGRLRAV